jgi:hypothetical protein
MIDTVVVMKNGDIWCGPIWTYNPEEGWLHLAGDSIDAGPDKLYFRDMESCITKNKRINISTYGDVDELEEAKKNGWDGVS